MSEPENWIEQAAAAGTELRDLIQEAHRVSRDLKTLRREMESKTKQFGDDIEHAMGDRLKAMLNELTAVVERASAGVYNRFDTIEKLLLGEDNREGKPTLPEVAFAYKLADIVINDEDLLDTYRALLRDRSIRKDITGD
jgi:DNA anti-recombination protein RmuC